MPKNFRIWEVVTGEKIFEVYRHVFLQNAIKFHNFYRKSPDERLCQMTFKKVLSFHWFSTLTHRKNKHHPWRPCFFVDRNKFHNFHRRSPNEHLCQIILKYGQWFPRRRFLKFHISTFGYNKPCPWRACCFFESQ